MNGNGIEDPANFAGLAPFRIFYVRDEIDAVTEANHRSDPAWFDDRRRSACASLADMIAAESSYFSRTAAHTGKANAMVVYNWSVGIIVRDAVEKRLDELRAAYKRGIADSVTALRADSKRLTELARYDAAQVVADLTDRLLQMANE